MFRHCSWLLARSSALRSVSSGGVSDDTHSCLGGGFGAARRRCKARSHYREPLGPGSGVALCHAVACRCADSRLRRQARVPAVIYAARAVGPSVFILKTWGKRSASGRRQPLVVKAGGRCGHVGKFTELVHMSMPTPPCPHSAARAVFVLAYCSAFRRRRSCLLREAFSFLRQTLTGSRRLLEFTMSYEAAIAVLFFSWGSGYVLGYKLRQIQDALSAI